MGLVTRMLERVGLLRPRFAPGGPRGVVPMFPFTRAMRQKDPELWERIRWLSPSKGIAVWCETYPEDFAED